MTADHEAFQESEVSEIYVKTIPKPRSIHRRRIPISVCKLNSETILIVQGDNKGRTTEDSWSSERSNFFSRHHEELRLKLYDP